MGQFRNIKKVVCHARHKRSGIGIVIERKGQFLQVGEKIPAHVCLHARSHYMPLRCDIALAEIPDDIQHQETQSRKEYDFYHVGRPLAVYFLQQVLHELRKEKINCRKNQCAEHVHKKHALIRAVIRYESLDFFHQPSTFLS